MKIRYVSSIDEAKVCLRVDPVVCVRNVQLTSYQLTELAAQLGRPIKLPNHAIDPERDPYTHLVAEDGYFGSYVTRWHADGGFTDDGKVYTCLYNPSDDPDNRKDLPTVFADIAAMPVQLLDQFSGWTVYYHLGPVLTAAKFFGKDDKRVRKNREKRSIGTCVSRPIIQPEGHGYYNASVAAFIEVPGLPLIDLAIDTPHRTHVLTKLSVFEHYVKANYTEHYWQPRDLLIYDNYVTQHARRVSIRSTDKLWRVLTQYSKAHQ
jgi:hypothetical protein